MMKARTWGKIFTVVIVGCWFSAANDCVSAQARNIARGKSVTFSDVPNYPLCKDDEDHLQLTDGNYTSIGKLNEVDNSTSLWVQKGTVGWSGKSPVLITVDLGEVQPISGVSYSTGAGSGGVNWPNPIYVAVSKDNKEWQIQGNLVGLSDKNGRPPLQGYAPFRYVTHDLKTSARYVMLAVASLPYVFTDEIEIFEGNQEWVALPVSGPKVSGVAGIKKYMEEQKINEAVKLRLRKDTGEIRDLIKKSDIVDSQKTLLSQKLERYNEGIEKNKSVTPDFKAIIPFDNIHEKIYSVFGELLAAQKHKPVTVWKQHRYAWLPVLAQPNASEKNELNFSMLKNQFRSDALFFTNAGSKAQAVRFKLQGEPRNTSADWLRIDQVEWTDTNQNIAVADALTEAKYSNGYYQIEIPAGMTRKVWFTVDSSKLLAGTTKSSLEIVTDLGTETIPVSFEISSVVMNKPRLSLGMWDYTDKNNPYGITPQNREAAIKLMRSHYVDTPWASTATLPRPDASYFDAQGALTKKLDFKDFDEWVASWPGATQYFTFPNVGDSFAGSKMNTPEFTRKVSSWAKALSSHMVEIGLRPEQLGMLLVDEPHTDAQDAIIAAWAKVIKSAAPELTLFSDPIWMRPDQAKIQEAITTMDIVSPLVSRYYQGGPAAQKYYANLKQQGKQLWFYQCAGPVRLIDPQKYFRHQAWHAFSVGATGQGFWAFGDTGKAESSWNEYSSGRISYAPAFLSKNEVHNSVHWDAVREGMQDFAELTMLQDAIGQSNNSTWKMQAQIVLDEAVNAVMSAWKNENYDWWGKYQSNLADEQLSKVREILVNPS